MVLNKEISALLLVFLSLQTLGCHTWVPAGETLPPVNRNPRRNTPEIKVYARDGSALRYGRAWKRDGFIGGDLLEAMVWNGAGEVPDSLPLEQVWSVEVRKAEGLKSSGAGLLVVRSLAGLAILAVMSADWSFAPGGG